jgi:hypothetical protein
VIFWGKSATITQKPQIRWKALGRLRDDFPDDLDTSLAMPQ